MLHFLSTLPPEVFDAIGVAGFGLYVLNYTMLTFQRVTSCSIKYFVVNWLAATFVLIGLFTSFNLAAALIQIFWIGISSVAIYIRLRNRPSPLRQMHGLSDRTVA
ncbi:CBU_0592 family membrane protein [Yoonia sp. 208BN28-4]|uniref:CBU_0592 family membrane protein n=1 Tax=Yoonia sp. 208BN28-4 TaxID=3126505 RepID=UPI0030A0E1D9